MPVLPSYEVVCNICEVESLRVESMDTAEGANWIILYSSKGIPESALCPTCWEWIHGAIHHHEKKAPDDQD